jgi:hypothetical protein
LGTSGCIASTHIAGAPPALAAPVLAVPAPAAPAPETEEPKQELCVIVNKLKQEMRAAVEELVCWP